MPEVVCIGLGGRSKIHLDPNSCDVTVGPECVGCFLIEKALVFGGPVLTATDIVVASGAAHLGDLSKVSNIDSCQTVLADEIGGGNGLSTFLMGLGYDIPVIDGDTMVRVFPTIDLVPLRPITACSLTDARGNTSILMKADSATRVEDVLRVTATEVDSGCAVCARPLTGDIIRKYAVPNTASQAWYLGRAVHLARKNKSKPIDAIVSLPHILDIFEANFLTAYEQFTSTPGKLLFEGKIIDVRRAIGDGYTMGSALLVPSNADKDSTVPPEKRIT
ncbi:DUF917 domain-containing protein [Aspergillus affinis]|uniref:DUF917 domain-containing protein n=1 Tax=Aspergillus affinis TaxID=1070780 RepID=UPI0022FEEFF4|nr:putative hydantoinase/oxoprolinase [Aspergillus affinis]KAI9041760.1 putative hydantoinase/oxoprolinase [Aspergillus affinis]